MESVIDANHLFKITRKLFLSTAFLIEVGLLQSCISYLVSAEPIFAAPQICPQICSPHLTLFLFLPLCGRLFNWFALLFVFVFKSLGSFSVGCQKCTRQVSCRNNTSCYIHTSIPPPYRASNLFGTRLSTPGTSTL